VERPSISRGEWKRRQVNVRNWLALFLIGMRNWWEVSGETKDAGSAVGVEIEREKDKVE
jgi:hypothetical protein